jgi:peptide/nickel transport system permease protein
LLPELLGGSLIIETIFGIQGMGKLTIDSIMMRDYAVINAVSFFAALLTLLGILLSDLSYALVDP